jgi:hypothetical protein
MITASSGFSTISRVAAQATVNSRPEPKSI